MHRQTLADLHEQTGAVVTVRGEYQAPGMTLPEGERKIYLLIEGPTEEVVRNGKREVKRVLEEATERSLRRDAAAGGRYQV